MRILFFLLGMAGFIIAGMLHVPLAGVFGFALAVVALFLDTSYKSVQHADRILHRDEAEAPLSDGLGRATRNDAASAQQPRESHRMPRHHVHHARRAQSAHASNSRQRRATPKEM